MYIQDMLLKNKENNLEIYTYQVSFPLFFVFLNIQNCQSVLIWQINFICIKAISHNLSS